MVLISPGTDKSINFFYYSFIRRQQTEWNFIFSLQLPPITFQWTPGARIWDRDRDTDSDLHSYLVLSLRIADKGMRTGKQNLLPFIQILVIFPIQMGTGMVFLSYPSSRARRILI